MPTQPDTQFTGYYHADIPLGVEDAELTRVGPRTPCGELMRRYWQPVALSRELAERPLPIRVLGEDLVLFRQPDDTIGLLHRHCLHRGASLEYGRIEEHGLRCCYHGWLYGADGTLLETPLEPPESPIRHNVRLGAYPVHEYRGLIFAYLGRRSCNLSSRYMTRLCGPTLPLSRLVTTSKPTGFTSSRTTSTCRMRCIYTHCCRTHSSSTAGVRQPGSSITRHPIGYRYTYSRRVEDNIWVGLEDIIFPNFTQAGAIYSMDGKVQKYFGRGSYSRWLVPLDDLNTRVFVLCHFNERSDPFREEYRTQESLEVMEVGTRFERSYEEKQREPSDIEAAGSQGRIYLRTNEHLGTMDKGVACSDAASKSGAGTHGRPEPVRPSATAGVPVPTCAGDTVLKIPRREGQDDGALIDEVAREVMSRTVEADHLKAHERISYIEKRLQDLERSYNR